MPLIPQQDIVVASVPGQPYSETVEDLRHQLAAYPPCRIVALTAHTQMGAIVLTAVIETI